MKLQQMQKRAGLFVLSQMRRFRWTMFDYHDNAEELDLYKAFEIMKKHEASNVNFFIEQSVNHRDRSIWLTGKFTGKKEQRYPKLVAELKP